MWNTLFKKLVLAKIEIYVPKNLSEYKKNHVWLRKPVDIYSYKWNFSF